MNRYPPTSTDTEQNHDDDYTKNDPSLYVVVTHLHARVAELETHLATLQQQQKRPTLKSRWQIVAANLAPAKLTASIAQRLPPWLPKRLLPWGKHKTPTEQQVLVSHTAEEEEEELAEIPLMIRMTIITLVSLLLGWASENWVSFVAIPWFFYVIAYINGSFYSIKEAWNSLKQHQFDINLLMIAAALGAAAINQPLEGATLMFLFSLSHTLETYAMGRTHANIRALIDMTPKTARVLRGTGNTVYEEELPVDDVVVGDVVRVRPGEQIPADGVVVRGTSAVNEASITGESLPVEKQLDAHVFAGTMNEQGSLDIRVTTASQDSTLAHIVKIVSEAREQKARSQHFTDKVIGQYYAYTVAAITLLAVLIPLVFLGWDTHTTVYRAITLMVAASPCALVISIPAAILSALASASWHGVLFKGGKHLESASKVKVVAFDKTGTLTTGQLRVATIIPLPLDDEVMQNGQPLVSLPSPPEKLTPAQERVLAMAATVEQFSEHPLAQAIVTEAQRQQMTLAQTESFESLTGFGVRAHLAGQHMLVGRPVLFEQVQQQTLAPLVMAAIAAQEQKGYTVILVGTFEQVWGIIALSDTVRPESADIVAGLKQAGICCVVLLTGDNRYAAEHLAGLVGIDEVHAGLTPDQKVAAIRQIQAEKGLVAMIGDGINDAPALATATLGVAMGAAGTDVAMESADVVLMSDDLSKIPGTLRLARRTRIIVRQNLILAFSVMLLLVVLSLSNMLSLTIATIAHEGSTLLVVANGLRLLAPWREIGRK